MLEIDTHVEVKLRLTILQRMGAEFGKLMLLSDRDVATVFESIGKKLLSKYQILLFDDEGVDQGMVDFEIDWKLNQTLARSSEGKSWKLEIDPNRSVTEQVENAMEQFMKYLRGQADLRGASRATPIFYWREDVDESKLSNFREDHRMSPVSEERRALIKRYLSNSKERRSGNVVPEVSIGGRFRDLRE